MELESSNNEYVALKKLLQNARANEQKLAKELQALENENYELDNILEQFLMDYETFCLILEEKLSKKEPSKSSKNPTNNNKKKKTPPKTNTEVLDKVNEATKIIEDFEETTALKKEDLKEVKEQNKKTTEELEATMYDLFKEEKPKKRKKKKK